MFAELGECPPHEETEASPVSVFTLSDEGATLLAVALPAALLTVIFTLKVSPELTGESAERDADKSAFLLFTTTFSTSGDAERPASSSAFAVIL